MVCEIKCNSDKVYNKAKKVMQNIIIRNESEVDCQNNRMRLWQFFNTLIESL